MRNPIARKFYDDCLTHYQHRQDRHCVYSRRDAFKSLLERRSMVAILRHQQQLRSVLNRIEAQARQACTERSECDAGYTPVAENGGDK